jgi:hypothetical protein
MIREDTAESRIFQQLSPGIGCDGLARRLAGKRERLELLMGVHRRGPVSVPGSGVLLRRVPLGYCLSVSGAFALAELRVQIATGLPRTIISFA